MNGKELKVIQYNLEFGAKDRFVNVFGCFKYIPNGNLYILYADVDMKYNIVYYGSAHIRNNSVLVMQCRNDEIEIIKEYIFKITSGENLDNFEIISLNEIEGIEIIVSDKLELKPDVLLKLVDMTIPKKEEVVPVVTEKKVVKGKKRGAKTLLVFLIIILAVVSFLYFFFRDSSSSDIMKQIICQKTYVHDEVNATVDEVNTYYFNVGDTLEKIDTTMVYSFSEAEYQDFILKGMYYKFSPNDDNNGGYKLDDENHQFKVMIKDEVDTSYNKPTDYEEVFNYYKGLGYTCREEIVGE